MKLILSILFLMPFLLNAQQAFQSGKYTIVRNNATTNVTASNINGTINIERFDVKTGTVDGQGSLLLTVVNRFFFYFNAVPALANITQEATSGSWLIAIPTTLTTNKAIFMPDKQGAAVVYSSNKYGFDLQPEVFPLQIRLLVNGEPTGALMCTIYEDGNIVWPIYTVRTASALGSTGLIQFFIN
jgi:hypothetical protein